MRGRWAWWGVGLGSLAWLLLRSGTQPRRLAYPCQRAALANGASFLGYVLALLGAARLYRRLRRRITLPGVALLGLALLLTSALGGSAAPTAPAYAALELPVWTSPTAVSNVFVVNDVPAPPCSLNGGTLPGAAPCNDPAYALHDAGVDQLIDLMESHGDYFYATAAHPAGVVGADDVVVIKVNNQWAMNGNPAGRLCSSTDVLKGLVWRILQHPDGFSGEVVVAENVQNSGANWNPPYSNAQDRNQSYTDVVTVFQSLGYPVSISDWNALNDDLVSGGLVGGGYPAGEYAGGNANDAYVLLEDPDGSGVDELSYPKFRTAAGTYVSMRYGVWEAGSYHPDRLILINLPVLKQHGMAGATVAWKNLIGFTTVSDNGRRYGDWFAMHGFFWGDGNSGDQDYGLLGRQMALVRAPDLNVVDAIWVANNNYSGTATRQDLLLASTDPFAVDWYASEHVLYALYANANASAARTGTFRSATRLNQNVAQANWPGGSGAYPYIDLLDAYDGGVPSDDERSQISVYRAVPSSVTLRTFDAAPAGPAAGVWAACAAVLATGGLLLARRRRS